MDDPQHSTFSRVPVLEDVIKVCQALNEANVEYVLIGGFAVIFHGYVRATKDIDFLVADGEENIKKIKSALSFLPDNAVRELLDSDVKTYGVVRIGDEIVIDLLGKACGHKFETITNEIEIYEIEGVEIPVASKELLIKLKQTIRPSDKTDVLFLAHKIAEENQTKK